MKRRLKSLLMRMLALGDSYPTEMTDKAAIQSLMDRLAPLSCARKLTRLGPAGDGGYLLPDDLDGIEACFSPGVSLLSGFETECAQRGMRCSWRTDRSSGRRRPIRCLISPGRMSA